MTSRSTQRPREKPDKPRRRLDLRMLAAALLAAVVVVCLCLVFKTYERRELVHETALNVARQLVAVPADVLTTAQSSRQFQRILGYQEQSTNFAFGAVYLPSGAPVAEQRVARMQVPLEQPALTFSWIQPESTSIQAGRKVLSWVGPVHFQTSSGPATPANIEALAADAGVGYYRIGFFQPGFSVAELRTLAVEETGFLAAVTLPVLLLALWGLGLMRRAVDPYTGMNEQISQALGSHKSAAGDPAAFAAQFNQFMEQAQARIDSYQKERDTMATSERFLHYRLNRFEAILHAIPDGVVVLDDAHRVTFANDRALRHFDPAGAGWPLEQVQGKTLGDALADNPAHTALRDFCLKFQNRSAASVPEPVTYSPASGRSLVLRCSGHAILSQSDSEATGYLVLVSDATREALAQEKRAEFVAHVSHELKSPLNTLGLCVDTLKQPPEDDVDDGEFRLEAVNIIGDEVERLAALISNLLNITQIEMGNMQPDRTRVRLADLVKDVFNTVQRSALDATLKFELDVPAKIPAVLVDKDLLRIALNNLVGNAIKYSNPNGVIKVSVEDSDEAITINVADQGIGIAAAEQTAIFNKFYRAEDQTARARGGQGLGLALAQEIVHMHHGAIRVASEPGKGSVFSIDLWKNAEIVQQAI